MDEITYTPGRLAKKLGISKATLMRHLRKTGLIDQCVLTQHGHWRIPYSLAVKISSPEALTVSPRKVSEAPHHKSLGKASCQRIARWQSLQVSPSSVDTSQPKAVGVGLPDYRQIGKTLRKAGFTMTDLIRYIQQQMEVTHEQSPYNSAQRNENQTVADPSTRRDEAKSNGRQSADQAGSANSDISNSVELGEGNILDFPGTLKALEEIGYNRWVVVCPGNTNRTDEEKMRVNREYLRSLGY